MLLAASFLGGAVGLTIWLWPNESTQAAAAGASRPTTGGVIAFPASDFADGRARYYQFETEDHVTVRFFVLKSSDGVIRAAFDACDVCWQAGKGYVQEGDEMVCRNCGRRFASVLVNEVQGGCNPAPLNRRLETGQVIIKITDLLEGRRFFKFSS
ncbi:MAG: DUF2318 domain-containing protein [Thermodesulfobacteriota bacterium]